MDRALTRADLRHDILKMRRSGEDFVTIAQKLGCRPLKVKKVIKEELIKLYDETCTDSIAIRALEVSRLDELLTAIYPRALAGEASAVKSVLNISIERRKLLGVDAPAKMDIRTTKVSETIDLKKLNTAELLELRRLNAKVRENPKVIDAEFEK